MTLDPELRKRAQGLHFSALVADAHVDTMGRIYEEGGRFGQPSPRREIDLPRLMEGGAGLLVTACCPINTNPPACTRPDFVRATMGMVDTFFRELDDNPRLRHLRSVEELNTFRAERARGEGPIGVILAIEGGEAIDGDLALLRVYHRLGVRLMTLTHSRRNEIGDGAAEEDTGGGLSAFGRSVVREMNRLRMVIDVSHLAEAGFWHVLDESSAPVIASHSDSRALCRHPRNLTDEQALALARKGGVIGINFAPLFLVDGAVDAFGQPPGLETVLDHFDHFIGLIGATHVCIGSDFDGLPSLPADLADATKYPRLTEGLLRRGHSEEEVRGILGENLLRVIETVWRGV